MIPPDYTDVSQESPREAIANVCDQMLLWCDPDVSLNNLTTATLRGWRERLRRAVQTLDAEQSPPEGPWRAVSHPARESGEMVHWIERPRNGKIRVLYFDSESEAVAVRDALNRLGAVPPAEQDTPQ